MRYFSALNIKDTEAYQNVNARLVYLHMCCSMDYNTREYTISARALASHLDMTYKAARVAIGQLLAVGLIRAQVRAQVGAQQGAQATTYIINGLEQFKGATEGATRGATEGAHIKNNNSQDKNKYSLAQAREDFFKREMAVWVAQYCSTEPEQTVNLMKDWLSSMVIKKREHWTSKEDCWQHLLDWCNKKKNLKKYHPSL